MTPESSEGRERITRLEVQVSSNARQIEMLGPLPLQMALIQRRQEEAKEDFLDLKNDIDSRFEKLQRSVESQLTHCSNEIARVAKTIDEREKITREEKSSDRTSRRAMWALIGAAAITGILTFLTTMVQFVFG